MSWNVVNLSPLSIPAAPSGGTWTEHWPYEGVAEYYDLVCNSTGSIMYVVSLYGDIHWSSTDYGDTWTQFDRTGSASAAISMSRDGSHLYSARTNIWRYDLDGNNVDSLRAPPSNCTWVGIAASYDGKYLVAVARRYTGTAYCYIYTSSNYGANWTSRSHSVNDIDLYGHLKISDDGSVMLCASHKVNGRAILSTNYGVNWSEITIAGSVDQRHEIASLSADGSRILISGGSSGNTVLFLSIDSGANWDELNAPFLYYVGKPDNSSGIVIDYSTETPTYNDIAISVDNGSSWPHENPGEFFAQGVALDMSDDASVIYVLSVGSSSGTNNYVVYRRIQA